MQLNTRGKKTRSLFAFNTRAACPLRAGEASGSRYRQLLPYGCALYGYTLKVLLTFHECFVRFVHRSAIFGSHVLRCLVLCRAILATSDILKFTNREFYINKTAVSNSSVLSSNIAKPTELQKQSLTYRATNKIILIIFSGAQYSSSY